MERRLTAILAADVVGYSRLMGDDETGTLTQLKEIRSSVIETRINAHQGRIVKLMGDGLLAEFSSVVNALACATDIQRAMRDREIQFRIGVNLGDVIVEDGDIYGDGVNVAVRLESIAPNGGITVSQSVHDQVGKRLDVSFEDRGEQMLKNIENPVRAYDVHMGKPPGTAVSSKKHGRPSIAVLPFNNMSGDPEQEYFSDGMTEDIITDLSNVSALYVAARNAAFIYKGKAMKVEQIGRELGVAFVLEGSVRKSGNRIRVTGQLVNCKDGGHVWAERFDRELTDIFAIQDEITHAIVKELKIKLLPQEKKSIVQSPTENVEAYTYYLRGRQFFRRHSKSYYQLARRMFEKAVELDPGYARAYAGIADCDSFLFLHYHEDVDLESILARTAKAIAIDNKLAEAHASRGVALSAGQRHEEGEAEFEQAIALDPNSFEAHYLYARASFAQGNLERAASLFERAAEINPDDFQSLILLIQIYRSLKRPYDTESAARRAVGRCERDLVLHPEDPRPAYMGIAALIALGENDRARDWIARALVIAGDDILTQYNVACGYTKLGDTDRALDLLERMLPKAGQEIQVWVTHDSDFDGLRGNPRFEKLLASIKNP